MGIGRPSVYDYLNYRNFLRDFVLHLKSRGEYSNRSFAKLAGLKSPVHLHLIIQGKKNVGKATAKKISRAFDLGSRETEFLILLINFLQSKVGAEAEETYQEILTAQGFLKAHRAKALEYRYYSEWHLVALLEALTTPWGNLPKATQAKSLQISESQLDESLRLLNEIGLIEKHGSQWVRKENLLKTDAQAQHLLVKNFHREMIRKALDSLENGKSEERNIVSVTLPLSQKTYADLNAHLYKLMHEFAARYTDLKNTSAVYQLNFQVFPLVKMIDDDVENTKAREPKSPNLK